MAGRRGIGRTEVLIGIAILAVLVLIVAPLWMGSSTQARRAEVPLNVDAIRIAQITYHQAFDEYVSADPAPRALTEVDAEAVPWEPTPGFVRLAWAPEQDEVYGAYQVVADPRGFTVTGTSDVDGDGERAMFTATRTEGATMVTDPSVY